MGCSGCDKNEGCETEKGPQRSLIDSTLSLVYPSGVWGQPDDEARFGAGIRPGEVRRLARAISVATKAPAWVRPGGPDDLCNFIYVLCVGREPSLLEVREGRAMLDAANEPNEAARVRERYLRLALSTVTRAACMQEVAMELDGDVLRELPKPGVYDDKLLKRMRAIVDLVEASGLEHLDFGLVDPAHPDTKPGDYVERYGVEPAIVNFLFYAQPARTITTTILAGGEARIAAHQVAERGVADQRKASSNSASDSARERAAAVIVHSCAPSARSRHAQRHRRHQQRQRIGRETAANSRTSDGKRRSTTSKPCASAKAGRRPRAASTTPTRPAANMISARNSTGAATSALPSGARAVVAAERQQRQPQQQESFDGDLDGGDGDERRHARKSRRQPRLAGARVSGERQRARAIEQQRADRRAQEHHQRRVQQVADAVVAERAAQVAAGAAQRHLDGQRRRQRRQPGRKRGRSAPARGRSALVAPARAYPPNNVPEIQWAGGAANL